MRAESDDLDWGRVASAGKFIAYQATVTLSDARSYGRDREAYAAMVMSAPKNPNPYWRRVTYSKGLVP